MSIIKFFISKKYRPNNYTYSNNQEDKIMKKTFLSVIVILFILCMLTGCSFSKTEKINIDTEYTDHIVLSDVEYQIFSDTLYYRGNDPFVKDGESEVFHNTYVKIAENVVHVQAAEGVVLYLTKDGKVYGMGASGNVAYPNNNYDKHTSKVLFEDCRYFSFESDFVLAIKNDNSLWFWGEDECRQSGNNFGGYDPHRIAGHVLFAKAFFRNSAWIDENGSLYLAGDNSFNQIGNGEDGNDNTNLEPYLALEKCVSFSVTDDNVVFAKTSDGTEYIWGNGHKAKPTKVSEEMPERIQNKRFSEGEILMQNPKGILRFEDSPIYFFCENDILYKMYGRDSIERKIVKSNAGDSILSSFGVGTLVESNYNEDCVYLTTFFIKSGMMTSMLTVQMLDEFGVPVYFKSPNEIVFAAANAQQEIILNTETGETKAGGILDVSKFENKPEITEDMAKETAVRRLEEDKYNISDDISASIYCRPEYAADIHSSIEYPYFENNLWVWCVKAYDENTESDVYIDAQYGNVICVSY